MDDQSQRPDPADRPAPTSDGQDLVVPGLRRGTVALDLPAWDLEPPVVLIRRGGT